jgi:hypothetical protein
VEAKIEDFVWHVGGEKRQHLLDDGRARDNPEACVGQIGRAAEFRRFVHVGYDKGHIQTGSKYGRMQVFSVVQLYREVVK